jgi:hypothetical protein
VDCLKNSEMKLQLVNCILIYGHILMVMQKGEASFDKVLVANE